MKQAERVTTEKLEQGFYRVTARYGFMETPNVPEILQHEATPENLAQAVLNSLNDPVVNRRLPGRLDQIRRLLRRDAAARATEALMPWLQSA